MSASRAESIARGLADVRARIDAARSAAGREDDVALIVVTKTFPASDVRILADLGVTEVAENRDQEASAKREDAGPVDLRWHMIGQLQRNKARSVVAWADVVETVDRTALVAALGRAAVEAGRTVEVLIQVSLDLAPRADRGGADPEQVLALADGIAAEPALVLRGVMGVAPFPGDPDQAFARLARVSAALRERWPLADRISAGMSGDLEQAVLHGATQVRVGGAVLGQRATVQ